MFCHKTLYDLNDVVQMSYDLQVKFLSLKKNISKKETVKFLADHHIYPVIKNDSKSATELFLLLGYDKEEWARYRDERFDVTKICIEKTVEEDVIKQFRALGKLVLLSSNTYYIIEKVLFRIGISMTQFDDIICSDKYPYNTPFKKKMAMKYIADKYNVDYKNIISIGDRYSTDILPMTELGGKGVLIKQPRFLYNILKDIERNALSSNEQYEYYE